MISLEVLMKDAARREIDRNAAREAWQKQYLVEKRNAALADFRYRLRLDLPDVCKLCGIDFPEGAEEPFAFLAHLDFDVNLWHRYEGSQRYWQIGVSPEGTTGKSQVARVDVPAQPQDPMATQDSIVLMIDYLVNTPQF